MLTEKTNKLACIYTLAADSISLTDPDDILSRFVNQQQRNDGVKAFDVPPAKDVKRRSDSVTTLESEPWLRPESRAWRRWRCCWVALPWFETPLSFKMSPCSCAARTLFTAVISRTSSVVFAVVRCTCMKTFPKREKISGFEFFVCSFAVFKERN